MCVAKLTTLITLPSLIGRARMRVECAAHAQSLEGNAVCQSSDGVLRSSECSTLGDCHCVL